MESQAINTEVSLPDDIVYIGRQPILDRNKQTYGYELLYHDGNTGYDDSHDSDQATARTMLNCFIEFGLQHLVGPHKAFFNLTKPFFTDLHPLPLDKSRLVLEVLENIEIDTAVIKGVQTLYDNGYLVALDDYQFEPFWEPLLPYTDIIKVDLTELDLNAHAVQIATLKKQGLMLLAEKVESHTEFEQALALGFDLFQGYFFAKPEVMSKHRLNSNQMLLLKMLSRINDSKCTIDELAAIISHDAKLSFKILRFIDSAAIGLPHKVDSIQQAVVYIGLDRMRAWASLFVMAGMKTSSPEVITTGLVRAEMCQAISKTLANGNPVSAYTIGLLSILDAVIGKPIQELVENLPLSQPMINALVNHTGPYGAVLKCTLAVELCDWLDEAGTRILPSSTLTHIYISALTRAEEIRNSLSQAA